MHRKPCILANTVGVLGHWKPRMYFSEQDTMVLEDTSGRIKIKRNDKIKAEYFITGTIIGLLGIVDQNGVFDVEDLCYAEMVLDSIIPKSINITQNRKLFDINIP